MSDTATLHETFNGYDHVSGNTVQQLVYVGSTPDDFIRVEIRRNLEEGRISVEICQYDRNANDVQRVTLPPDLLARIARLATGEDGE